MADVVFSDVLCFLNKNIKRFDKSTLLDIVAKFYHEDELYDAKSELCKTVANLQPDSGPPDGWSKFINSKGLPIMRRMNDPIQRRRAESDDLLQMMMILDVNKVTLPNFVITDPDRVPTGVWSVTTCGSPVQEISMLMTTIQDVVSKFNETINAVMQRLSSLEMRLLSTDPVSTTPVQLNQTNKVTGTVPHTSSTEKLRNKNDDESRPSVSWAEQAAGLTEAGPNLVFKKPSVRIRGQASTSSVKGVPRQLTCFASRLHLEVTEDELSDFLRGQGILDVKCRKLEAKDGRVFRTSAFRVSCSSRYESLFYDEARWPEGVELRDWVFYNRNG